MEGNGSEPSLKRKEVKGKKAKNEVKEKSKLRLYVQNHH